MNYSHRINARYVSRPVAYIGQRPTGMVSGAFISPPVDTQ